MYMTIPLEQAQGVLSSLGAGRIQNLFAQSHAKHVLHEVNESPDNFPAFDQRLDDKVTFSAYALLAASCSLLEQRSVEEGVAGLEKAAVLLQNIHGPFVRDSRESSFHALVSSMAFYAAGHYSRAFVTIRSIESTTMEAGVIASFIRKDFKTLVQRLSVVLLQDRSEFNDQADLDRWAITIAIAQAIAYTLEYIITGAEDVQDEIRTILEDASVIAIVGLAPSHWWIIRLLKLMLHNLRSASLWNTLPPFFDPEANIHLDRYIRLLAFSKTPVIELWASQRAALSLVLNPTNRGGVVNLRTSAGKTRVAELAILQTLCDDPTAKIIYLAPFRSLAFEVERTLSGSFLWLGFQVSHLYGGSRVSSVDTELVSESSITIATPEKARALFRAIPDIFENVKLIILDEGHLFGPSERYVRNELFVDHLRSFAQSTGARMLLLSAVLPNTRELAEWVAGDPAALAISSWKPSAERFGLLRWNGKRVRIDWLGEVESFNPSFIEAKPVSKRKNSRLFPKSKTDAVASTAVRLSNLGPVMIFAGQAQWVPSMANAVLQALGISPPAHPWPAHEWKVFEAVCMEELEQGAVELEAARVGIVCHSNRLTTQVRLALEVLMRSHPPKIIIATTTLGQGVNVGISSIIISTPYIGHNLTIDKRDFWNICGRAGRAFVDGEGKILYAIDDTRKPNQIRKDKALADSYFNTSTMDRVESGLLHVINILRRISDTANVPFEVLIELVANNDFEKFGEEEEFFEYILDLIDDELLALHEDESVNLVGDESVDWVDQAFQKSLATIQASAGHGSSDQDDVIAFLKARAKSTLRRVTEKATRKAIVSSGLPMSVAITAHRDLGLFRKLIDEFLESEKLLSDLNEIVQKIEDWVRENAHSITDEMPKSDRLSDLRMDWLGGAGLNILIKKDADAAFICKDLYGYQLPWVIHAISQKLDKEAEEERIKAMSLIALLVEIGVPTELAARIFLAGIRSRVAATELSRLDAQFGDSVSAVSNNLLDPDFMDELIPQVSTTTAEWLRLILADESRRKITVPSITPFKLKKPLDLDVLYARNFEGNVYLCSLDGRQKVRVKSTTRRPFNIVADDPRFVFEKSGETWLLSARDPRCERISQS
jgi:hypothetical protein